MLGVGLLLVLTLVWGQIRPFGFLIDYHTMLLGSVLAILGMQILSLGWSAKVLAYEQKFSDDPSIVWFLERFSLERGLGIGVVLFLVGMGLFVSILLEWIEKGFQDLSAIRPALMAMTLTVLGVQLIFSAFFISLLILPRRPRFAQDSSVEPEVGAAELDETHATN